MSSLSATFFSNGSGAICRIDSLSALEDMLTFGVMKHDPLEPLDIMAYEDMELINWLSFAVLLLSCLA